MGKGLRRGLEGCVSLGYGRQKSIVRTVNASMRRLTSLVRLKFAKTKALFIHLFVGESVSRSLWNRDKQLISKEHGVVLLTG